VRLAPSYWGVLSRRARCSIHFSSPARAAIALQFCSAFVQTAPLGIRIAERANPRLVPWAWAVNGCATVIGTLVAVIAGMSSSFTAVTLLAVGVYAAGVLALLVSERGVRGRTAD
jgi:hypothetical protein